MLSATVVADGHNRVLPLMPEFVQPQQDPAADQPELSEEQRQQDSAQRRQALAARPQRRATPLPASLSRR